VQLQQSTSNLWPAFLTGWLCTAMIRYKMKIYTKRPYKTDWMNVPIKMLTIKLLQHQHRNLSIYTLKSNISCTWHINVVLISTCSYSVHESYLCQKNNSLAIWPDNMVNLWPNTLPRQVLGTKAVLKSINQHNSSKMSRPITYARGSTLMHRRV